MQSQETRASFQEAWVVPSGQELTFQEVWVFLLGQECKSITNCFLKLEVENRVPPPGSGEASAMAREVARVAAGLSTFWSPKPEATLSGAEHSGSMLPPSAHHSCKNAEQRRTHSLSSNRWTPQSVSWEPALSWAMGWLVPCSVTVSLTPLLWLPTENPLRDVRPPPERGGPGAPEWWQRGPRGPEEVTLQPLAEPRHVPGHCQGQAQRVREERPPTWNTEH